MVNLITLWSDSPRWLRGWFIGNLAYVALALIVLMINFFNPNPSEQLEWLIFVIMPVFFTEGQSQVFFHLLWCVLGAFFVSRWGEKAGLARLLWLFVILKLGILGLFIYFLTNFFPIF